MLRLPEYTKDTPNELYYKLDPVYESDLPTEKQQIITDSDVLLNNEIDVEFSAYNGIFPIGTATTNSFTILLQSNQRRVLTFLLLQNFHMKLIVLIQPDQSQEYQSKILVRTIIPCLVSLL